MSQLIFPPLSLADWRPSRDTLQIYARVLGKIRRALTPPQKHWWHISLRVVPTGLTTAAIPVPGADETAFEIILSLQPAPEVTITTSRGETWAMLLNDQSVNEFYETVLAALAGLGIEVDLDRSLFADASPGVLDPTAVQRCCQVLVSIDRVFNLYGE